MPQHLGLGDRLRIESFHKIGEDVELGVVVVDADKCKGCNYCVHACPAGALEVVEKKARMVLELPMCMSCGDCTAICPEGAITLTKWIEFKRYFRYLDRGRPEWPRQF